MSRLTREQVLEAVKGLDLSTLDITGFQGTIHAHGYCPHCGIGLDNGVGMHEPSDGCKHSTALYMCLGCGGEFGPLLRKRKGVSHVGKKGARNRQSVKQWLKLNAVDGQIDRRAVEQHMTATGRSMITANIQAKAAGVKIV